MKPEEFKALEIRAAVARIRDQADETEVDDETLALFIDRGIGAVPLHARTQLLRAIGQSPELASLVCELAQTLDHRDQSLRAPMILGVSQGTWRVACAACATLAVGLTAWRVVAQGFVPPAEVRVLGSDGGQLATEQFAMGVGSTPSLLVIMILWLATCGLMLPALGSARRAANR
ncbi:MAG: hypothetical protein EXS01_05060 [Phycisphaerales bacterium]|nr:hypothetical protein [Phycisphaerales bacterium]